MPGGHERRSRPSHSVFASLRGAGSWTLHPTPIEAHARSRRAIRAGRRSPSRPRSSSVPSYRPPHDDRPRLGPLSPGSGKGQSRERPSATRSGISEREREPVSNQAQRAAGPPGTRPGSSGARRRTGTGRSLRAHALAAPVGRRAHGSRSLSSRSRRSASDRTPCRAAA